VTPSDLATVLVALDATVPIAGHRRERALPAARLYTGPGETALRAGEIVTAVRIPAAARARTSGFEKLRLWEGDFAVVSACASLDLAGGIVRDARIVLGAIAPTPYRARAGAPARPAAGRTRSPPRPKPGERRASPRRQRVEGGRGVRPRAAASKPAGRP
jgi:CO/xanthine dehydrogenase FAD-binding subunit